MPGRGADGTQKGEAVIDWNREPDARIRHNQYG